MHMPDTREHIAVRYQALGFSVIPLDAGDKRPHAGLLPGRQWGPYQQAPAPRELVRAWAGTIPDPNWGLICGQVSHGLYCGDCDNLDYSRWVIDHARDPLMRGACIVRTGSGKAHIWFLSPNRLESHVWKPRAGAKVGDVRGDGRAGALGSYMAVPPSVHPDTGLPYEVVAGSFESLPVIDNGEAFLAEILAAYRQEVPEGPAAPPPTSRAVLTLTPEERLRIQDHVRDLRLKRKISDTLLVPGMQAPGSKHWTNIQDDSRSGVDFAVVCELIRKGESFEQVEQIFAATEIGNNRYLSKDHKHSTGYAYIRTTYDNAKIEIDKQVANSRVARGVNFEVVDAVRIWRDAKSAVYRLVIQFNQPGLDPFVRRAEIPAEVLGVEDRFTREVFVQTGQQLRLGNNHKGKHNYPDFAQAVSFMVTEDQRVPAAWTREGHMAMELLIYMRSMASWDRDPVSLGEVLGLGWRRGDTYYLKMREVYRKLQSMRTEFHYEDLGTVLSKIGETEVYTHYWQGGGEPEHMVKVTRRDPNARRELPALPAPS